MEIISDYRIISKIRYFVIDNASNNNIIIEALSTYMYKQFTSYKINLQFILQTVSVI